MAEPIYLDYNASTPCDPRVVEAMLPFFTQAYANPASRHHGAGRDAFMALEKARTTIARCLGATTASEIVFTSGTTEANNLTIAGVAAGSVGGRRHVLTQVTEHPSVLGPIRALGAGGWTVTEVGVGSDGTVLLDELGHALRGDTALVSVMMANNETGTVQPVAKIVEMAHDHGAVFHCDAAQGVGKLPLDVSELGVELLSFSGHKICGPKGIGALYVRRCKPPLALRPQLLGGGQEGQLRSGTVNVPGAVGLARAVEIAIAELDDESARVAGLRDCFEARVSGGLDGVHPNGAAERLPGTSNLSFAGIDGNALLASLPDVAVSTGSACTATHPEPSPVLTAMGVPPQLVAASLRISLGRFTSSAEIDRAADRVIEEVTRLRARRRRRR